MVSGTDENSLYIASICRKWSRLPEHEDEHGACRVVVNGVNADIVVTNAIIVVNNGIID
jgi:hypothetical protein